MNILHIYKDYYPVLGGIENHMRVLAEAQAESGHRVTVLTTNSGPQTVEQDFNGVRVIRAGRQATLASTPLSASLPRTLRALRPDITHLQSPYPLGEMAQWWTGPNRPYVISYQAEATRPVQRAIMLLYRPLWRRVLRGARRILVASPSNLTTYADLRPLAARATVVPLGVDPARFQPAAAGAARPPTLLFVGVLRHYKGVDDLLRAMALLPEGVRLLVAGEGPRRAAWEALARELRLEARVQFLGRVADEALPGLYQSADVFVLPANSRAESFGTVLVEAMASGLPCVTTDIGTGTAFVVQDEKTGLVVRPRHPAGLARALKRLVDDRTLRARMGAAGRSRVLQHFTERQMIDAVERVYREVSEGQPL